MTIFNKFTKKYVRRIRKIPNIKLTWAFDTVNSLY